MKLHVRLGPLPMEPPYLDWEDEADLDLTEHEDQDEIDLTDLLDHPAPEILH